MLDIGHTAPAIPGLALGSDATLVVFFETDCPTCRLAVPYLNKLARAARVIGISQDDDVTTSQLNRPDFDAVYVPHPIQDQTAQEIAARADAVLLEIVARLAQL